MVDTGEDEHVEEQEEAADCYRDGESCRIGLVVG